MKLILCRHCATVTGLDREVRTCSCGRSQAVYLDNRNAIYSGPCVPIGMDNESLADSANTGFGAITTFVIREGSRYFRRVDK